MPNAKLERITPIVTRQQLINIIADQKADLPNPGDIKKLSLPSHAEVRIFDPSSLEGIVGHSRLNQFAYYLRVLLEDSEYRARLDFRTLVGAEFDNTTSTNFLFESSDSGKEINVSGDPGRLTQWFTDGQRGLPPVEDATLQYSAAQEGYEDIAKAYYSAILEALKLLAK